MKKEIKIFQSHELNPEVAVVIGTRPGIVMFAPIIHELRRTNTPHFIIHTGQHYSPNMDSQFFTDLNLPQPDYRLENVSERKTHGAQTAAMLEGIEAILMQRRPRMVLVGGDANTNLAGALAGRKLQMRVGHVEAGERSYDWRMPEEHNRIIIDNISDYLFVTDKNSIKNLKAEGIRGEICETGNPIVDASLQHLAIATETSTILSTLGIKSSGYAVLTMHREENVDNPDNLRNGLQGVADASRALKLPVIFLAHPRTSKRIIEFGLEEFVKSLTQITMHNAIGYLDFLKVIANAHLVFTDSGGVQQEACIHHVPCITLRDNTEWVQTVSIGANRLSGCVPEKIVDAAQKAMVGKRNWEIPFGDGSTAQKIVAKVAEVLK